MVGATIDSTGVRAENGTETVTRTKFGAAQLVVLTIVSSTSVQAKVTELVADDRPGTRFSWVSIVAAVSALLPSVQRVGEAMMRDHPALAERLIARWIGGAARYAGA